MGRVGIGESLQFPSGDNATDVLINGVHFNRTTLEFFNYTLWTNGTLSNESSCYLLFDRYRPYMFSNGTFVNTTSCYGPYYNIQERGALGIAFAVLFAASIMFSLVNLRKHGRLFLPTGKRFRAVGRRWQWYWLLFVGTCGTVSGFMSIDVDRWYLQGLPIVLQGIFFLLMPPAILAAVWESVRHWGSWQERQIYDRDNYSLGPNETRERKEFWMPLIFYLFAFMNFFLTVPRAWTTIEYQRSAQQQDLRARPTATDGRFKAASFFAFCAWSVICYSLHHSIHHYRPQGFLRAAPTKHLLLLLPLTLIVVGYSIATSFDWTISPLKSDAAPGWIYGLGYGPILLTVMVFEVFGYRDENEDRVLLEQRRRRGRDTDAELGIVQKPGWWSKRLGGAGWAAGSNEDRLKAMTREIGGGRATHKNVERGLELGGFRPTVRSEAERGLDGSASKRNDAADVVGKEAHAQRRNDDDEPDVGSPSPSERSGASSADRTSQVPATQIRSMLDV